MRLERLLVSLTFLAALGGCATGGGSGGTLETQDDAQDAARIHTELGQQYMRQGDLKTALDKLQKALQFDDNYAPAHTVIAVLYERIGQPQQAEQHYRRAVQLDPKKGDTNNNFAVFLCKENKVDEALPYFKRATQDPFYSTPDVALTNAGTCVLKKNDTATAIKDYRRALTINPRNGEALYQLASVFYKTGDAFRASAFMQRYDALGLPSPASLLLGYRIETRLGDSEGARNYAKRLHDLFPDSEQAQAVDSTEGP